MARSPCAAERNEAPRRIGLHGGALHQPPAPAYITQRGPAELARGPAGAVEARAGIPRGQRLGSRLGRAELCAPVRLQRVDEDRLDRDGGAGGGEAPAPGGPADAGPVGGGEAGAVVALAVDEGLQQQGRVAVAQAEVGRQAAQAEGEHLGGEIGALHGGAREEARQAEHAVQLAAAEGVVPADPAIAVGQGQRRGGEADGAEDAVVGHGEVAQLGADMAGGAAGMLAGDKFVPSAALRVGRDEFQGEALDVGDAGGDVDGGRDRMAEAAGSAGCPAGQGRGQLDATAPVENAQGLEATGDLQSLERVVEAELAAMRREPGRCDWGSAAPRSIAGGGRGPPGWKRSRECNAAFAG